MGGSGEANFRWGRLSWNNSIRVHTPPRRIAAAAATVVAWAGRQNALAATRHASRRRRGRARRRPVGRPVVRGSFCLKVRACSTCDVAVDKLRSAEKQAAKDQRGG